jgi:membrane associated rhomboid family serine protease
MTLWEEIKYKMLNSSSAVNQIVLINLVVFAVVSIFKLSLFFFNLSEAANAAINYLYVPGNFKLFLFRIWTPITYQFMHTGIFHILFNMLMFYFMGTILHDFLGSKKVWITYLGGGIIGALVFLISYSIFPVFAASRSLGFLVGASGSVMAITAAAATLIPEFEVMLFGVFRVKLKWLALGLILIDIAGIPSGNPGGGIAHLGGAFFGMLYILSIQGRVNNPFSKLFNNLNKIIPKSSKPDEKKIYREKVYSNTESKKANNRQAKRNGRPNQDEIDAILDKISNSGYDSLTKEEKEILFRASE